MNINFNNADQVSGILLGLMAGDRIGGPGQMALQLATSLLNSGGYDENDIGNQYLYWWKTDGYDSGPTSARVFSLVQSGLTFSEAAYQVHTESGGMTAGCNPVHRNLPLAMSALIPDIQLSEIAHQESRLTHWHEIAGDVSAAACMLARGLLRGVSWYLVLENMIYAASPTLQAIIQQGLEGQIYPDGYAPHVLASALHFVHSSDSFDEALERSISFAGLANFCPVLVGSFAGARWGKSAISEKWFENTKQIDVAKEVAQSLSNQW